VVVFVFASFAAVLGLRGLWGGPWLMEVKGLSRIDAGNVLLVCTVALTIGPALAGLVLRRVGHGMALLAGSHLLCAGIILGLVAGGGAPVALDIALLALFGVAISFQVLAFSLVRAAVRPEQTGRALSAANLSFFFGAAVLQGLSGLAAAWGGIAAALLTFSVALVACTLGFLALQRRA
jgi:predicted MFS family arabinose efflux permease